MKHELRDTLARLLFSELECPKFWSEGQCNSHLPCLFQVAPFYLTVPASAVPQEREFSEFERKCDRLRIESK